MGCLLRKKRNIILARQHVRIHCKQQAGDQIKNKRTPEKAVTLYDVPVQWLAQLVSVEAPSECARYSLSRVSPIRIPAPTCTLLLHILLWLNQCELTQPPIFPPTSYMDPYKIHKWKSFYTRIIVGVFSMRALCNPLCVFKQQPSKHKWKRNMYLYIWNEKK